MPRKNPEPTHWPDARRQIGANIRQARLTSRYSQDALAQKIGVSWATIKRIEWGHRSVAAELLLDLARTLGTSVEALVLGRADLPAERQIWRGGRSEMSPGHEEPGMNTDRI